MRTRPSDSGRACGRAACDRAQSTGRGADSSCPLCSHCTAATLTVEECRSMSVAGTASMPFFDLLACPLCGGELVEERDGLVCNACARTFPLSDGVPDLLPSEPPVERAPGAVGRALSALVAMPRVYDAVQRVAGAV